MTNEEFEQVADEIIQACGQIVMEEESLPSIINPIRYKQIMFTYKVLEKLLEKQNVKVTYELHQPFQSVAVISILGKDFKFTNTEMFIKLCRIASNIDVYARTDGKIKFDLTFHGLTKKL